VSNGRCIHCYGQLLTGDVDGVCSVCKNRINNHTEYVTYEDKQIGYVKSVKMVNGLPRYDIEITDEETKKMIYGDNLKPLSLGYKHEKSTK